MLIGEVLSGKISDENKLPSRLMVAGLFVLEIYAMYLNNRILFIDLSAWGYLYDRKAYS